MIYWKLGDKPTGRYRSFNEQSWPTGYLDPTRDYTAFFIRCKDGYTPALGRATNLELTLYVADRREAFTNGKGAWDVRKIKGTFSSLTEAKLKAEEFLKAFPEVFKSTTN